MAKPIRRAAILAAGTLLLTACSGEPSEGDMRQLVEAHVAKQLAARRVTGFSGFTLFRKQGCVTTKDRPDSWDCYYNLTFKPAAGQAPKTLNGKGRFQRSKTAATPWSYQELGAMPDDRPPTPGRP